MPLIIFLLSLIFLPHFFNAQTSTTTISSEQKESSDTPFLKAIPVEDPELIDSISTSGEAKKNKLPTATEEKNKTAVQRKVKVDYAKKKIQNN